MNVWLHLPSIASCICGHKGGSKELCIRILRTLVLLRGNRQALGSVWRVAPAADAGAGATLGGTGHLAARRRALPGWRERGHLSPEGVSVLPGKAEGTPGAVVIEFGQTSSSVSLNEKLARLPSRTKCCSKHKYLSLGTALPSSTGD